MGSMTTPPCMEDVLWVVVLKSIMAEPEDLIFIDRLFNVKPSRHLMDSHRRPVSWGW